MSKTAKYVKKTANRKHINILLAVLLVVCLVFAGTVLGKYIVEKTFDDKLSLTITGAPQGNTLMVGAKWADYEWGTMSDGFGYRLKALDGDGENLEKIVFCGQNELPTGLVTDWNNEGVNVDAADKGNVKAFYDADSKSVYVASKDNEKIGTNKYAACMFKDMTSLKAVEGLDIVDTSKTETMDYMFSGCSALTTLDVSGFDTGNVTSTTYMFAYCSSLTSLDVSRFDTAKVETMSGMFSDCSALTELDVSGFDTGAATDMAAMFSGCSSLTELDVSGFKTGNVWNFYSMFYGCSSLDKLDVSGFDTSSATDMGYMFAYCAKLTKLDLTRFDTDMVTGMGSMFMSCEGLTKLNLSSFVTQSVTAIDHMFYGCKNLETIYVSEKWDTSHVVDTTVDYDEDGVVDGEYLNTQFVFEGCDVLVGGQGTSYADMKAAADEAGDGDFTYASSAYAYIDKALENGGTGQKGYLTLYEAYTLVSGPDFNTVLHAEEKDVVKVIFGSYNMYATEIGVTWDSLSTDNGGTYLDVEKAGNIRLHKADLTMSWDTYSYDGTVYYVLSKDSSIILAHEDCSYMFQNMWTDYWGTTYGSLGEIVGLDIIDTGYVTNMSGMFYGGSSLKALDLSGVDTGNVTDMSYMFYGCYDLDSLNVSSFDTSKVTNMESMFNLQNMYIDLAELKIDVSSFDTSNVTNMHAMFSDLGERVYTLDLSGFDTSKVTDMSYMFSSCTGLTKLDISGFSTAASPDISWMFSYCEVLETIYASDLWDPDKITAEDGYVFYESQYFTSKLVGGEGTTHAESAKLDTTNDYIYARLDEKVSSGTMGLFTDKNAPPVGNFTLMTGTSFNSVVKDLISDSGATKLQFGSWAQYGKDVFDWTNGTDVGETANTIKAFANESDNTVYILSGGNMFANADSSSMFRHNIADTGYISAGKLTAIDGLASVNTSKVENMSHMFEGCTNLAALDVTSFDTSLVEDMSWMFRDCAILETLTFGEKLVTTNVTNMQEMFRYVNGLTTLDVSNFDTSKVTNMQGMFQDSGKLTTITGLNSTSFNTGSVTNMSWMFKGCSALTSLDLSGFDTGSVLTMERMFGSYKGNTLDVSNFDTSSVTTMHYMFDACSNIAKLDLSNWNTSAVTGNGMQGMFNLCENLAQIDGLTGFDTSKATTMREIFAHCAATSLDLSSFDTSNVTDMVSMFYNCEELTTIYVEELWNTDKVTISDFMFYRCYDLVGGAGTEWSSSYITATRAHIDGGTANPGYLTGPSVTLTTGSAFNTAINGLFSETVTKLQFGTYDDVVGTNTDLAALWNASTNFVDVDGEGTIRVFTDETTGTVYVLSVGSSPIYANADSSYMLAGYRSEVNSIRTYLKEISGFNSVNMSKVTNMSYMFDRARVLQSVDLDKWDTGSVTNMRMMFYWCEALTSLDLSGWDTGEVTDMSSMFNDCGALSSINVSNWDTGNVETMWSMFYLCSELVELDLSHFNTAKVTSMNSMFGYASKLTSLNLANWDTSKVQEMQYMFYNCTALPTLDVSHFDTGSATDMRYMFYNCSGLTTLGVSNWSTGNVSDMSSMFYGCTGLTTLDVSNWSTGNVSSMSSMFYNCKALTVLDVSNWSTGKVTNMAYMFYYCQYLTELDVTNFDTTNVTSMNGMFFNCLRLAELDVSGFKTGNVTNMSYMFTCCFALLEQDFSGWDTSKVTNMNHMFFRCYDMPTLDLRSFNTSNVTDMGYMFAECTVITSIDVSSFDTSKVTNMEQMFSFCSALTTLDLSSFDTGKVTKMLNMFYQYGTNSTRPGQLKTIYVTESWTTAALTDPTQNMFSNCLQLVGGEGTVFDSTVIDATYARIDKWISEGEKGYLTDPNAEAPAPVTLTTGTAFNSAISNLLDSSATKLQFGTYNDFGSVVGDWDSNYRASVDADGTGTIRAFVSDGTVYVLSKGGREIYANADSSHMFRHNTSSVTGYIPIDTLTAIGGLASVNTSNVTNMSYMFSGCTNLVTLDLSKFNTSKVTDMSYMFEYCGRYNMTSLDVSKFDTSKVTNMRAMFSYCGNQKITSLDVSNFVTSNVTTMRSMFNRMEALTELKGVEDFDTKNVTVMREMFSGLSKMTAFDVSGYNTSKVDDLASMFYDCSALTELDLSSFNTSKVNYMGYMFHNCSSLKRIYVSSTAWSTASIINSKGENNEVFDGCTSLVGGAGSTYASNHTSYTYARIDKANQKGYLTNITQKTDAAALSLDDASVAEAAESDGAAAESGSQDTAAAESAADSTVEETLPEAPATEESATDPATEVSEPDAATPDAETEDTDQDANATEPEADSTVEAILPEAQTKEESESEPDADDPDTEDEAN